MADSSSLLAALADVTAEVEALKGQSIDLSPPASADDFPVWNCTALPAGTSMSADWESTFDDRAYTRVYYNVPFSNGYASMPDTDMTSPIRYKAAFDADQGFTVNAQVCGESWGTAHVKINGTETTYTSDTTTTMTFKKGRNEIVLMKNGVLDGLELRLKCVDGIRSRWVKT